MAKKHYRVNRIILAFVMLESLSCQKKETITQPNNSKDPIQEALTLWQSLNIHAYTLEQRANCLWCPWDGDSARIVIKADTIWSIILISTQSPLEKANWGRYKTIDQLFAIAQYDTQNYVIQYSLDSLYHFPKWVSYQLKATGSDVMGSFSTYRFTAQ